MHVSKGYNIWTRVPRSQRGGEIVEPLISEQWFVSMQPLAQPALAALLEGKLRIFPERFAKIYSHWLENIKDWCISRQLWWGHRIPVWYVLENEKDMQDKETDSRKPYIIARDEASAREIALLEYGKVSAHRDKQSSQYSSRACIQYNELLKNVSMRRVSVRMPHRYGQIWNIYFCEMR